MLRRLRSDALRVSEITHLDVCHAGETYRITLKRIATARRFTLRVRVATRDVVLSMPPRSSIARAKGFAERHAAWIGARLNRLPTPMPFGPGSIVPLRGIMHKIEHNPWQRGTVWIEPADALGSDSALHLLCVSGEAPHIARRVHDFLMREAKRDIEAAVVRHAATIGVTPRKITLRDTTSRWGSCSSSGSLNFSWRLIMAPSFVLDYLAAHEVAHLVHMNHSAAFWQVLAKMSPHVETAEAWLKANGAGLLRFGPLKNDSTSNDQF
jgi:predicted metal-dependent hydrolase